METPYILGTPKRVVCPVECYDSPQNDCFKLTLVGPDGANVFYLIRPLANMTMPITVEEALDTLNEYAKDAWIDTDEIDWDGDEWEDVSLTTAEAMQAFGSDVLHRLEQIGLWRSFGPQ